VSQCTIHAASSHAERRSFRFQSLLSFKPMPAPLPSSLPAALSPTYRLILRLDFVQLADNKGRGHHGNYFQSLLAGEGVKVGGNVGHEQWI